MAGAKQRGAYPADWTDIATRVKQDAGGRCVRCDHLHDVEAGYVLTVHHFDGDKSNCDRWNLMPLCQRCHLSVQGRVDPKNRLLTDVVSVWAMPYVAGCYEHSADPTRPIGFDLANWIDLYAGRGLTWPDWAPTPCSPATLLQQPKRIEIPTP